MTSASSRSPTGSRDRFHAAHDVEATVIRSPQLPHEADSRPRFVATG
jgi:hypothetical protein